MKEMRIHNVRMGFATNSSSSHSLIFLPPNVEVKDKGTKGEYGWDYFTATSTENKRQYLALLIYYSMRRCTTEPVAQLVAREWSGALEFEAADNGEPSGYIDHQSVITLPTDWTGRALHKGFVKDFSDFLLQPGLAILGGNDNDGTDHPLLELEGIKGIHLPLAKEADSRAYVARWDALHKFWTIFNRSNGSKIRFTFSDAAEESVATRSSVPELVDLKITDYCPIGCEFCYQGSTLQGKHAGLNDIRQTLYAFSNMEIFEVAIGGGEPTLHPNFVEILEYAREYNIIPNFTTRRLGWLRNVEVRQKVLNHIGAFAYSAHCRKDVSSLARLVTEYEIPSHKVNIQLVMGTVEDDELEQIMCVCAENKLRLTLLGYKHVGRGKQYKPLLYRKWLQIAHKVHQVYSYYFQLGIDTVLAAQFDKELETLGVDRKFYSTKEGAFSMYYDAVEKKMGPSSFCEAEEMVSHKLSHLTKETFLGTYRDFADANISTVL